jgi:hypothetical protein
MEGHMPLFIRPGVLPASCQRSIFILSTSMLAFTGKVCHITELSDLLRCFTSSKVSSGAENNKNIMPSHAKYFILYFSLKFWHALRCHFPAISTASASVLYSK